MNESLVLRDATVQDIQLELIRRTKFNDFDGEKLVASLLKHRHLWLAVLLDRPGVANYAEPTMLLTAGLIKLRDLADNYWNADTLFVLTRTQALAEEFARVADEEEWSSMTQIYKNQKDIDMALGTGRQEYGLLSMWWD